MRVVYKKEPTFKDGLMLVVEFTDGKRSWTYKDKDDFKNKLIWNLFIQNAEPEKFDLSTYDNCLYWFRNHSAFSNRPMNVYFFGDIPEGELYDEDGYLSTLGLSANDLGWIDIIRDPSDPTELYRPIKLLKKIDDKRGWCGKFRFSLKRR